MANETVIPNNKKVEQPAERNRKVSATFLGWFLAAFSALTLISVFYIGDLISTGVHRIISAQELSAELQAAKRPDQAINDQATHRLPASQRKLLEQAAGVYALMEKGELKRARQLLEGDRLPGSPAKHKLSAVLSWVEENNENASAQEAAKAKAENRRRAMLAEHGGVLAELGETTGETEEANCVDCAEDPLIEATVITEYRDVLATINEHEELIKHAVKRKTDLERMALEHGRDLLQELARPVLDETTLIAYREASVHAQRLGLKLPGSEL